MAAALCCCTARRSVVETDSCASTLRCRLDCDPLRRFLSHRSAGRLSALHVAFASDFAAAATYEPARPALRLRCLSLLVLEWHLSVTVPAADMFSSAMRQIPYLLTCACAFLLSLTR